MATLTIIAQSESFSERVIFRGRIERERRYVMNDRIFVHINGSVLPFPVHAKVISRNESTIYIKDDKRLPAFGNPQLFFTPLGKVVLNYHYH